MSIYEYQNFYNFILPRAIPGLTKFLLIDLPTDIILQNNLSLYKSVINILAYDARIYIRKDLELGPEDAALVGSVKYFVRGDSPIHGMINNFLYEKASDLELDQTLMGSILVSAFAEGIDAYLGGIGIKEGLITGLILGISATYLYDNFSSYINKSLNEFDISLVLGEIYYGNDHY